MDNPRNALAPGYKLHWYTIKKILGQGGFGITYLAEDTNLNQEVAIKEFLPIEMAVRDQSSSVHPVSGEYGEQFKWGLDRFMSEAQTLAKFKHPNIVRVFTVFPENNTAYMVMEYEHGKGLDELIKNKNTLNEEKLKSIILPILDGLKQVHASGFIHRDIKPANIFIRDNGSPVLLDFGSARQSFGEQTRTLTAMISPGFAPFEQYTSKSDKQGPWTDIYGIAATMYRAIIGRSPAEAMDRSESLLDVQRDSIVTVTEMSPEGYSANLLSAIDHGLAFKPEDRPQTLSEWIDEFAAKGKPSPSEVETIIAKQVVDATKEAEEFEKTEVVEKTVKNKKTSLLKRIIKYTIITLFILIILSILTGEDKNTPSIYENNLNKDKPVKVQKTSKSSLITDADREKINLLQKQIKIDPQDKNARKELQSIIQSYESEVKALVKAGDYDKAIEFVKEVQAIAPQSKRLKTMLKRLENRQKEQNN